jgi:hypothetical protein
VVAIATRTAQEARLPGGTSSGQTLRATLGRGVIITVISVAIIPTANILVVITIIVAAVALQSCKHGWIMLRGVVSRSSPAFSS